MSVHLQDLLERSSEELTKEQRSQLAELLAEFQDVFVRCEFELEISRHKYMRLTPGTPPPSVKEKMRRSVAFFAG